jgi:phospholipase C
MSRWLGLALVAGTVTVAPAVAAADAGIAKIRHIVVIVQENRSFDQYFGTFPGAVGIPMRHRVPVACLPDPNHDVCERPYHNPGDIDGGGIHDNGAFLIDWDHGRMDGFLRSGPYCVGASARTHCVLYSPIGVMAYHDSREIPNYWAYARTFVLQDHMFEPVPSWSLPAHLVLVSEWSAFCTWPRDPFSCRSNIEAPALPADYGPPPHTEPNYAWTDLTYLLHRHHVTWAYYIKTGPEPDCETAQATCPYRQQAPRTPGIWNPLPSFDTVRKDRQLSDIRDTSWFYWDVRHGHLPAVSWVIPDGVVSEHPTASIRTGQAYVTGLINTIARSPEWPSTAIFLTWDDWGGFYDNVAPPRTGPNGFGFRVPGLVISAYARRGFIDHRELSFDAFAKFIEDDFLGGARLNPKTDGRPDPRPVVRETLPGLGDLQRDFDFNQRPRAPLILARIPRGRREGGGQSAVNRSAGSRSRAEPRHLDTACNDRPARH